MHKGDVIEEDDHESLMRARGIYFGLVEQQHLRNADEEEQLAFERQESTGIFLVHQAEENVLGLARQSISSITSVIPYIMTALYGNINEEEDIETKKKEVKITVTLILINIILLGKKA
jgi:hypothetical protein